MGRCDTWDVEFEVSAGHTSGDVQKQLVKGLIARRPRP
jgi:hypothetical protein